MKRLLLIFTTILFFGLSAHSQIYQTIPGYGFKWQRVAPDSVLHLPSSADTSLRTSYTTRPQIRAIGDSVWFYTGSVWNNITRGVDSGAILSQVVRTYGAQTIGGVKTFTNQIVGAEEIRSNATTGFGFYAPNITVGDGVFISATSGRGVVGVATTGTGVRGEASGASSFGATFANSNATGIALMAINTGGGNIAEFRNLSGTPVTISNAGNITTSGVMRTTTTGRFIALNGSDSIGFNGLGIARYQNGFNSSMLWRNLSANRTVYFQNKSYTVADSADVASIAANYLPLSGGTLTGSIFIDATLSNTVQTGSYFQLGSSLSSTYWIQQMNASNDLDFWYYGGSWAKKQTFTNTGGLTLTGVLNGTSATFSGLVDGGGTLRATGATGGLSSGIGVEIRNNSGTGEVFAYNRTSPAYTPLKIDGSTLSLNTISTGIINLGGALNGTSATFNSTLLLDNTILRIKTSAAITRTALSESTQEDWLRVGLGFNAMVTPAVVLVNTTTNNGTDALQVAGSGLFTGILNASTANGSSSLILSNTGVQNSNRIELRGGTGGTAVNWVIEKDNTVANAIQFTPSTTNGGTTYTTPVFTLTSAGAATLANLAGTGNRIVYANSSGTLGSMVIGSGLSFDGTTLTASGGTSGTYLPTATNISGASSFSVDSATYIRIGDVVHVTVRIALNATSSYTGFRISLPVASNFTQAYVDAIGVCSVSGVSPNLTGQVNADTTNDEAVIEFTPTSSTGVIAYITFQYRIK